MRTVYGLVVFLSLAASASARDVYVDNAAGDDRAMGRYPSNVAQLEGPVRTIAKALRLAQFGDRIILAKNDEPYRESVSLIGERHSGYDTIPFTIEGNGATLDGSWPVPPDAWRFVRGELFAFQPPRLGYQMLFLDGRPMVRKPATSLNWAVPYLEPMEWTFAAGEIYVSMMPREIPHTANLSYAALPTAFMLLYVHDVRINNLIVQGFQTDGINAHDCVRNARFNGVTARGNGRSGITVSGGSRVQLDGCTLGDNGVTQLLCEAYSVTYVDDSDLIANTGPGYTIDHARLFINETEVGVGPGEAKGNAVEPKGEAAAPADAATGSTVAP